MRTLRPLVGVIAIAVGLLTIPLAAADIPAASTHVTKNLQAIGYSARIVPTDNASPVDGIFNSDLAFWGKMAVQGTYEGFRLIDIKDPANPVEIINFNDCQRDTTLGNQGDITIWGDILARSWNSNTPAAGAMCDGEAVPAGFEGIHVFDISDRQNPELVGSVDLACGSHTQTMVPDVAHGRVLIYNGSSSGTCQNIDIVEVPLDNPAGVNVLRQEPTEEHPCHDIGVILGDVMKVGCAGGNSLGIYSLDPADGGSLEDPMMMHHIEFPGVTVGHSAAFTWDGKYAIFGHEPGGGAQAQCQATSSEVNRSLFFVDVEMGDVVGTIQTPRPQTNLENCTWHNYNVIPTEQGYFLVSGNYQAGVSVIDFTDPTKAKEIAYADPAPLVDPNPPVGIELGGDWSTYAYNGLIFESDILRGLIVWEREAGDVFRARQKAARDALDAQQAAAKAAFDAQQAAALAAFQAQLAVKIAACNQISNRQQRQQCLRLARQEENAFTGQQKEALQAFNAAQNAEMAAFLAQQEADKAEFQRVGVALNTGRRLDHLNPQTQEFSFDLDPAAVAPTN